MQNNQTSIQAQIQRKNGKLTYTKENIKDVNLQVYPQHRVHFLVDAIIKGNKLPSEQSMARTEKRNQLKRARAHNERLNYQPRRTEKKFQVPNKYGPKPDPERKRRLQRFSGFNNPNIQNNIESIPLNQQPLVKKDLQIEQGDDKTIQKENVQITQKSLPKGFCFTQLINPQYLVLNPTANTQTDQQQNKKQKKSKLPTEIKRKTQLKKQPTVQHNVSKKCTHRFEDLQAGLKTIKQQIAQGIQTLRSTSKPKVDCQQKVIPEYFQRKKKHQQRRRLEKHILIVNNKQALLQIFGNAIFKSGWPVSRKQIKEALGIEQQKSQSFEDLADLLKQMNQ